MSLGRQKGRGGPTIKDIAAALGVSHATVSRALNDSPLIGRETKERVRGAAERMGYLPDQAAKVMRGGASNIVGFILPDVQNHFYSTAAKIIAETASAHGMQLVLAISEDDPDQELRHVRELRQARARGIVITPGAALKRETAALLNQMPAVQLVRRHPALKAGLVAADDHEGVALSTRHLLELGHRRIAYIGGGRETLSTGEERLGGFEEALAGAGLSARNRAALVPPRPEYGYEAALGFLRRRQRPTSLVLGSSQFTLGALQAIAEQGLRIPRDISLVGYDDPDWFAFWGEGISTIALPIAELARHAADRLCAPGAGSGGREAGTVTFPAHLVRRGTTAPPPG